MILLHFGDSSRICARVVTPRLRHPAIQVPSATHWQSQSFLHLDLGNLVGG